MNQVLLEKAKLTERYYEKEFFIMVEILIQKMLSSVHFPINYTFVMAEFFKSGYLLLVTGRNIVCVNKIMFSANIYPWL